MASWWLKLSILPWISSAATLLGLNYKIIPIVTEYFAEQVHTETHSNNEYEHRNCIEYHTMDRRNETKPSMIQSHREYKTQWVSEWVSVRVGFQIIIFDAMMADQQCTVDQHCSVLVKLSDSFSNTPLFKSDRSYKSCQPCDVKRTGKDCFNFLFLNCNFYAMIQQPEEPFFFSSCLVNASWTASAKSSFTPSFSLADVSK